VTPRTSGVEGTISWDAFNILNRQVVRSQKDMEFLEHCKALGWLAEDGRLRGSPRIVNEPVHLTKLQIEITNQCNLKCRYCFNESEPHSKLFIGLPQLGSLLRQAEEMGVITIDFSGGEFFFHENWRELLRLADELQFQISIHTNGTPLTERTIDYLKNFHISLIQVSLDSHKSVIHDEARGQIGSWSRAIAGLRRAVREGFGVSCVLMVHKLNKDHVGEATRWFRDEFGFTPFLDRLAPSGRELGEQLALGPSEFYEVVAPHLTSEAMVRRVCETPSGTGERIEPHCGVAHSLVYVTAGGELCLCPTMTSRDASEFAGPNIQATNLRDAWYHHPLFVGSRNVNCRNVSFCKAGTACRGGCRSNAYFDTGEIDSPDFVSCNIHKNGTSRFFDFRSTYDRAQ
jgi:radical SAM protein with 4Fe4S-binding SPASM domain